MLKVILKNSDPEDKDRVRFFPVVDNSTSMNLLYIVRTSELYQYLGLLYGPLEKYVGNSLNDISNLK